ncbi:carboxylesterase/lipase family protein [Streptomyces sp. CA-249302]|uniref:carboxylesterase/lipase family protein n=1 Tax=Streptomyces sp. CA-249302 TaxID=3240058 RepID=UPI003D93A712
MTQQICVTTSRGPVLGTWRGATARFLGIPYAKPPVGELRFAAPVPPESWTEPVDAALYGPTAQRRPFLVDGPTTVPEPTIPGADVLNLNVFTPDPSPDAGLPVLVWIHGGGYIAGCSASPWYDGSAFCRDGVILVSLGYRLGIEGHLHLEDAPDNRAVLDWIAALTWVRDNITAFGGDPGKVTVAGQSAGGGAVQTLMATPTARGLFRAAISMSGVVREDESRANALAVSQRFTHRTGLPATVAALRDLTNDELLALQDKLNAPEPGQDATPGLTLAPFADGTLVPLPVLEAFAGGTAAPVPLLLGFTHHEFNHAVQPDAPAEAVPLTLAGLGLSPQATASYLAVHEGDTPAQIMGQALTDALFRGPALAIAEARAGHELPTWLYQFDWASRHPRHSGHAFHCLELPFVFDLLDAERAPDATGPNPPQHLADAIHGSWVSFIRDLAPGSFWPCYDRSRRRTMIFDTTARVLDDPLRHEREIWDTRSRGPATESSPTGPTTRGSFVLARGRRVGDRLIEGDGPR